MYGPFLSKYTQPPGFWHAVIDLEVALFLLPIYNDHKQQITFTWQDQY